MKNKKIGLQYKKFPKLNPVTEIDVKKDPKCKLKKNENPVEIPLDNNIYFIIYRPENWKPFKVNVKTWSYSVYVRHKIRNDRFLLKPNKQEVYQYVNFKDLESLYKHIDKTILEIYQQKKLYVCGQFFEIKTINQFLKLK